MNKDRSRDEKMLQINKNTDKSLMLPSKTTEDNIYLVENTTNSLFYDGDTSNRSSIINKDIAPSLCASYLLQFSQEKDGWTKFVLSPYNNEIAKNASLAMAEQVRSVQRAMDNTANILRSITSQFLEGIPNLSYFSGLSDVLEKLRQNPNSLPSWMEYSRKLSEYIWTIPYGITPEELKDLINTVSSEKEFDRRMLEFFSKSRTKSLFNEILSRLSRKHAVIAKQIENAYYAGSYALANVGILSIIDELCSQFMNDRKCLKRKDMFIPIIEEEDTPGNMSNVIPLLVLNNNINVIYEKVDFNKRISIRTNKKARRNPSQHGQSFSNRKIDTIMLLNTVYYLLMAKEWCGSFVGRLIYVNSKKGLLLADTAHSTDLNRFYLKKKGRKVKVVNYS